MDATTIVEIVLVSLITLLIIALFILWVIDSRLTEKQKELELNKKDYDIQQSEIVKEEVFLRVKGGRVGVLRELPVRTVVVEQPKPEPPIPIIEEYKSEFSLPDGITDLQIFDVAEEKTEQKNFSDSYERLSEQIRSLYNQFAEYVMAAPNMREEKGVFDVTFKYRQQCVARAFINKDVLVLRFYLIHDKLKRYINKNGAEDIKVGYTNITLQSDKALESAKEMADIVVKDINDLCKHKMRQILGKTGILY